MLEVVGSLFAAHGGRPLQEAPLRQIVLGRVSGEEVILTRISDEAIELHCHGGSAAVAQIEQILVARGCRIISWQDWVAQQESDPIAAAARIALADARTTRTAAILLDQYHGALRGAFEQIDAAMEADDFPTARRQIDALLAHAETGLHLTRPWQVVIAGRPNVGKSSLINAIAGYQRAIVHSLPGTTRDVLSVRTALNGWPVEISDTAGLRESDDPIERSGIELALSKIEAADLIVLVFDASVPWTEDDEALAQSHSAGLLVGNKCDLPPASGMRPAALLVSAATSAGVNELCHAIAHRLVPNRPSPGAAVPFLAEQVERLKSVLLRQG